MKILLGDANVYRDTNNNPVIFVIALRPFIPFLSRGDLYSPHKTGFVHTKGIHVHTTTSLVL